MSKKKRKKGGGFGQWVKNSEKEAQRREHDWHVPNKVFHRITDRHWPVLHSIESALLDWHRIDKTIDDRTLLDGMKCAMGTAVSIDPRANKIADRVRGIRKSYNFPDETWRDILRVVIESIHNHSGLTPGATGYIDFIREFVGQEQGVEGDDDEPDEEDWDEEDEEEEWDEDDDTEGVDPACRDIGGAESRVMAEALLRLGDKSPVMPCAWFQRQDWPRLLAEAADPDTLPKTYDEWLQTTTETISQTAPTRGLMVIHFNIDEWRGICVRVGTPRDERSRRLYVVMKMVAILATAEVPVDEEDAPF